MSSPRMVLVALATAVASLAPVAGAPGAPAASATAAASAAGATSAASATRAARPCAGARTCYVDVSVAEIWTAPDQVRTVDARALTHPVDIRGWLADLGRDGPLRHDVPGETQALYGTRVTVERTWRDARGLLWDHVLVDGQPSPKDTTGRGAYPGWVPDRQLTSARAAAPSGATPKRIAAPTAWAYTTLAAAVAAAGAGRATEYSYGTAFSVRPTEVPGVERATAHDGTALYLRSADLTEVRPHPTGADAVTEARRFLGLDYLWSGASAFGYDCSGLTSQVYAMLGVTVPRDTQPQFDAGAGRAPAGSATGTRIAKEDLAALRPGDVLAFGQDEDHVTHAGLYTGTKDGRPMMINSPRTGERVREEPFLSSGRTYLGATRFLP
ncbi:C40 family peptidase [Streptomyces sp. WAC06614]|uniref:C40 family peptidase n=1 Tax=Streptomyces sp. WAC06614 TaxID=2487416 RepID=UPI000F780D03|nr:NlpC/P60 family protein [Streptomyces sp. WAC06614]RSS82979.1 hypothetical protein EF918_05105 [Streptomyces sp. WAC06614]